MKGSTDIDPDYINLKLRAELKGLEKKSRDAEQNKASEEVTKTSVIGPLIRALGFDVMDTEEVIPEYPPIEKNRARFDYAIKIEEKIAILIEAKTAQINLNNSHWDQLRQYLKIQRHVLEF